VPTHQGGFLLDGGVHFIAGIRLLLGSEEPFETVCAHTAQLQQHLPPVDTLDAVLKTKNGVTGTVSISFGTTFKGTGYSVACEKGVVNVMRETVKIGGETKEVPNEKSGVPPEVRTWGEAIMAGQADPRQSPEEALADLELLEAMLKSGEQGGQVIPLKHQTPVWNKDK
jgi:predicted dehydrogenase